MIGLIPPPRWPYAADRIAYGLTQPRDAQTGCMGFWSDLVVDLTYAELACIDLARERAAGTLLTLGHEGPRVGRSGMITIGKFEGLSASVVKRYFEAYPDGHVIWLGSGGHLKDDIAFTNWLVRTPAEAMFLKMQDSFTD